MATKLQIEEPFKLYYVDAEGDTMLVMLTHPPIHAGDDHPPIHAGVVWPYCVAVLWFTGVCTHWAARLDLFGDDHSKVG